jgi:hypothetical protein
MVLAGSGVRATTECVWGGMGSRPTAAWTLRRGPRVGASFCSSRCFPLFSDYDFGGDIVVVRPWVSRWSLSVASWCRNREALLGVFGGTKVVRLVILGFMEAMTRW